MELFRFMSIKEFDKLINGETLKNNTHHKTRTTSIGFCFMKTEDNTPEEAYEFLSGVVSSDLCVVFETNKKLTKSYGIYASPYGGFFDTITEDEYCTKEYNLKDFKIIKMAIPRYFENEWKWQTKITEIRKQLKEIEKQRLEKEKEEKIKKKLEDKYEKEQLVGFKEFYEYVQKNHKIEIKMGNKYYILRGYIECIESTPNSICGVQIKPDRIVTFKCEL